MAQCSARDPVYTPVVNGLHFGGVAVVVDREARYDCRGLPGPARSNFGPVAATMRVVVGNPRANRRPMRTSLELPFSVRYLGGSRPVGVAGAEAETDGEFGVLYRLNGPMLHRRLIP